jgi:hypothetical protein
MVTVVLLRRNGQISNRFSFYELAFPGMHHAKRVEMQLRALALERVDRCVRERAGQDQRCNQSARTQARTPQPFDL